MSLFTRLFVLSRPSDSLAPYPFLRRLYYIRVIGLIFIVVFLVLLGSQQLIDRITFGDAPFPWGMLFCPLIWLCGIGISFVIERWYKPLEALRLAAVQGDHRLLTDEQPHPNAEALEVPVKISMRISRKGLLVFGVSLICLAIGLENTGFLLLEWLEHLLDSFTWVLLLAGDAFVVSIMALGFVSFWRLRWVVEVRPDGIRSWQKNWGMTEDGASLMFWHEARLFACYRRPSPWKHSTTLIYELSSSSQVVLWSQVQKEEPLRLREAPTIPFEEHQAQMRALRELVAAKTGLPLYDLSTRRVTSSSKEEER